MAVRLRVQLGFAPPGEGPVRFWWQPPQGAGTIAELLYMLGADLSLETDQRRRLAATMDGFMVLGGSRTDLLRDGDTLLVSLGNKRGLARDEATDSEGAAVQQRPAKRRKPQVLPAAAAHKSSEEESSSGEESSSSEEESSCSEEESSSSEEGEGRERLQEMQTPAAPAPAVDQATSGKRPSRSARRKAAKRRLRRMGVLPASKDAGVAAAVQAVAPSAAAAANQQPTSAPRADWPAQVAAKEPAAVQVLGPAVRQQQSQHLPEVVVPADWQPDAAKRHGQQPKLRGSKQQPPQQAKQSSGFHAVPPRSADAAAAPAALPALQPAMSEAAFRQLPPLVGEPTVGDMLAYRLLEIGANLQPAVSEVRCGRVTDVALPAITLAPHPDPTVHPLAYQRSLRREQRLAAVAAGGEEQVVEEESDIEEPGSQYDDDGLLTAELASFVELRVLQSEAGRQLPLAAAPAGQKEAKVAARPVAPEAAAVTGEELGPSSYSQLGPPRPASQGVVIAAEGGWASLYEQLRQRRAQLVGHAAQTAGQPGLSTAVDAGTPKASSRQPRNDGTKTVHSAPPSTQRERSSGAGACGGRGPNSLTPGATRPRGGVRRTALGPMLRLLRESQELS